MTNSALQRLEARAKESFGTFFPNNTEVLAGGRKGIQISPNIYSPVPDVVVGPFSDSTNEIDNERCQATYDSMAERSREMILQLKERFDENLREHPGIDLDTSKLQPRYFKRPDCSNPNSRCFVAVEIENATGSKHLLGSAINAIALGRIALLVGFNSKKTLEFLRALGYLSFANDAGKIKFVVRNAFVLSKPQFEGILDSLNV